MTDESRRVHVSAEVARGRASLRAAHALLATEVTAQEELDVADRFCESIATWLAHHGWHAEPSTTD